MKYDDDSLERALAALPLEETPGDLHERIMTATLLRPEPVMRGWELLTVAIGLAIAAWLTLAILGSPLAGGPAEARAIQGIVDAVTWTLSHLLDARTALWLAAGAFAAILFSQIGIPGTEIAPEIRTET